jgi:hypothetical protein
MAGPGAGQTPSKVAVSMDQENSAYGGFGPLLPATWKAAAAGQKGPAKGRPTMKAVASVGLEDRIDGLSTKKKPAAIGGSKG